MTRALYWITNDLRLKDNPALNDTMGAEAVLPAYIYDTSNPFPIQGAAAWWLHHSLNALNSSYKSIGLHLHLEKGDAFDVITTLVNKHRINKLVCARAYTPHERALQKRLANWCSQQGIAFKRFASSLLAEPETIKNQQGSYYKVFTPFSKAYAKTGVRQTTSQKYHSHAKCITSRGQALHELALLPKKNWAAAFSTHWQVGEDAAWHKLIYATEATIPNYEHTRNALADEGTSILSAHLRFGELSPAQVWQEVSNTLANEESAQYRKQLIWRDFNHHLLFHRPDLVDACFNAKFNTFPWQKNDRLLTQWQQGRTGYPVVDAAMNQLWQTGWMHNRARMVVASFLTKHLLLSWQHGAEWFWDTLVDADLANNIGGWQWTAGCGADAAPYFRIFNPTTQAEKFDPHGHYITHWLPQLAELDKKYLFCPWQAPQSVLDKAGVVLGNTYPEPIVDHSFARKKALEAYQHLQGKGS